MRDAHSVFRLTSKARCSTVQPAMNRRTDRDILANTIDALTANMMSIDN